MKRMMWGVLALMVLAGVVLAGCPGSRSGDGSGGSRPYGSSRY